MATKDILSRPLFKSPMSILRIWLGIAFIMHGTPGIFNPDFMEGHIGMMKLFDLPFPELLAYLSKGGELLAGVLLLAGLFIRPATLIIIINMLVAVFFAMQGDIFGDFQGEISFTYLLIAIAVFLKGADSFSLDHKFFSN